MITHVVLLQPKVETTGEELSVFLDHVRALQEIIPGIIAISAGNNRSPYHSRYTHGIIMRFVDEAHLQAHHPHPAHLAVVKELDRLDHALPHGLVSEGSQAAAAAGHSDSPLSIFGHRALANPRIVCRIHGHPCFHAPDDLRSLGGMK